MCKRAAGLAVEQPLADVARDGAAVGRRGAIAVVLRGRRRRSVGALPTARRGDRVAAVERQRSITRAWSLRATSSSISTTRSCTRMRCARRSRSSRATTGSRAMFSRGHSTRFRDGRRGRSSRRSGSIETRRSRPRTASSPSSTSATARRRRSPYPDADDDAARARRRRRAADALDRLLARSAPAACSTRRAGTASRSCSAPTTTCSKGAAHYDRIAAQATRTSAGRAARSRSATARHDMRLGAEHGVPVRIGVDRDGDPRPLFAAGATHVVTRAGRHRPDRGTVPVAV